MNNNSTLFFALMLAALAATHIDTRAAAPASSPRSSFLSNVLGSYMLTLPTLTAAQQEKLDAFKLDAYTLDRYENRYKENPSFELIVDLVKNNIHPNHIRYGHKDSSCALGWAMRFSPNLSLAQYLLEHGASPNTFHENKPLFLAAKSAKATQLLFDYNVDIKPHNRCLLQEIISSLDEKDPKLIALYIKQQGLDPDCTSYSLNFNRQSPDIDPPMLHLLNRRFYLKEKERECAQHLIEGGASLSYKIKNGRWRSYTIPLFLKKKLLEDQKDATDERLGYYTRQGYQNKCDATPVFIAHVKTLADNRRENIRAMVATHLPVTNKNKIDKDIFPLANLVTDYYEPEFDQMYNEPFSSEAASSSSSPEEPL